MYEVQNHYKKMRFTDSEKPTGNEIKTNVTNENHLGQISFHIVLLKLRDFLMPLFPSISTSRSFYYYS